MAKQIFIDYFIENTFGDPLKFIIILHCNNNIMVVNVYNFTFGCNLHLLDPDGMVYFSYSKEESSKMHYDILFQAI